MSSQSGFKDRPMFRRNAFPDIVVALRMSLGYSRIVIAKWMSGHSRLQRLNAACPL